jgi:hypothetical protein
VGWTGCTKGALDGAAGTATGSCAKAPPQSNSENPHANAIRIAGSFDVRPIYFMTEWLSIGAAQPTNSALNFT